MPGCRLSAEEGSAKVHVDDSVPGLLVERFGVARDDVAGVVHQHVEPAELLGGLVDDPRGLSVFGEIADDADRPGRPGHVPERIALRPTVDGHRRTGRRERERHGASDPPARPGHERGLPGEVEHSYQSATEPSSWK